MKPIQLSAVVNLRAAAGGKPRKFEIAAYSGGVLRVDGFALPVVVDLQGLQAAASVAIVLSHDLSDEATIGSASTVTNDGQQVAMSGVVTGNSPRVLRALAMHDAGHPWQASIGCAVEQTEEIPAGQAVRVNRRDFVGPIIVARRSVLRETSIVPVGADASTKVNLLAAAAALTKGNAMDFESWVKETYEIDAAQLSMPLREKLMAEFKSISEASPDPVAAGAGLNLRASRAAEFDRIARIEALCVSKPLVAAAAIRGGWSVEKTELEVLRAQQATRAPAGHVRHNDAPTSQVLEAAVHLWAGQDTIAVKAFGERTVEQARRQGIRSYEDLAKSCLEAAGKDHREFSTRPALLKAAASISDLPTVLSNTVGRSVEMAYRETDSEWRKFCHIASAETFKAQTGIRPDAFDNLLEVTNGRQIKETGVGEQATYSWRLRTFARMINVDRQTIINDDVGFLDDLAPSMGRAAARTLNDLIWETILGGQTANFFSTGNLNLATTSSALGVGTLGAAVAAMRSQRDSKNNDIGIAPQCLAVGPGLELTARALLNSAELLGLTSGTTPNGNPVVDIVPNLIVESRIGNTAKFSDASATQWFLFGGPNDRPVTVGFLNSQQSPTVESEPAPFNELGQQWRIVHDFGVALADPKAAYKATGAA